MKIYSLEIENLRSIKKAILSLSPQINVLIGSNNSGKSSIIRALYLLQNPNSITGIDTRLKSSDYSVKIGFSEKHKIILRTRFEEIKGKDIYYLYYGPTIINLICNNTSFEKIGRGHTYIPSTEPNNFIYPFFSKRKVINLSESVNINNSNKVNENFEYLYSKIDRISFSTHEYYSEFVHNCKNILGFEISPVQSANGKKAGIYIDATNYIYLDAMGEGVVNLLGLILDLTIAKDKLFLIEEPENDIHPKALKNLLDLIVRKSETNQFLISTHSNIVTKYLGSYPTTKIFYVSNEFEDKIPVSTVEEINEPNERIKILREMGYELIDFDLYEAYLLLEESSAERIIRDFLIPEFVPELKYKLKTIAADGVDDIEPRFSDFRRIFTFIHTSDVYKNKAWVIADGDEAGENVITKLRDNFKSWPVDNFINFSKDDFERYYPERFAEEVNRVLLIKDKAQKRKEKKELLNIVLDWISKEPDKAKSEFEKSAVDVITTLKLIEKKLTHQTNEYPNER